MSNALLSLSGWYFLPPLVTGYVQTALYSIFIRAGDPKPQPGSPRFVRDRRRIQICVIVLYLLYTIYDADWQLQQSGDFYSLLGVEHDVSERALQSRFRRLTVQFHPDKAQGDDRAAIDAIYVQLQLARDTLLDPAKRFAYDRFGPEMLHWRGCTTIRDFVFNGVQRATFFYIGSGAVLVLLGVLGYLETGRFWRYTTMAAVYLLETHVVTRPEFPAILSRIVNPFVLMTGVRRPYLPFQLLTLARKISITIFIALAQLGPLLKDPQTQRSARNDPNAIAPQDLDRNEALLRASSIEVNRLMGLELLPFTEDPSSVHHMRTAVKEWLSQNTVRNDPEVQAAIRRVVEHRSAHSMGS